MTRPFAIFACLALFSGFSATGCLTTRGRSPGSGFAVESQPPSKSGPRTFDHQPSGNANDANSVNQAGGAAPPVLVPPASANPEMWQPGMPPLPAPRDFGFPAGDPHTRSTPTASGAMLNLQPGESATDRVVGLARELGLLSAQAELQQSRIRELEATSATREQSLAIATRELELLRGEAADVSKARAETAVAYSELTAAKEKLRQVQAEDVETLKKIIATLERLFPPPRREP